MNDLQAGQLGAHPRSRGENSSAAALSCVSVGSSPLTRGKPPVQVGATLLTGLIPAHAGKTSGCEDCFALTRAHPRSRGENERHRRRHRLYPGSSPLTRGKHGHRLQRQNRRGLIPAHAGKTSRVQGSRSALRAHPRSRGENSISGLIVDRATGSSPLTRGKHYLTLPARPVNGLIPAHAGKTPRRGRLGLRWRAHPRSRGENRDEIAAIQTRAGSSPLTRGKRAGSGLRGVSVGLIPAHAGKTRARRRGQTRWEAHPRSRGENIKNAIGGMKDSGSSPLTRGKHHRVRQPAEG